MLLPNTFEIRVMEHSIHINISRLDSGDYLGTSREFQGVRIIGNSINDVFERMRTKINQLVLKSKK